MIPNKLTNSLTEYEAMPLLHLDTAILKHEEAITIRLLYSLYSVSQLNEFEDLWPLSNHAFLHNPRKCCL